MRRIPEALKLGPDVSLQGGFGSAELAVAESLWGILRRCRAEWRSRRADNCTRAGVVRMDDDGRRHPMEILSTRLPRRPRPHDLRVLQRVERAVTVPRRGGDEQS